MVTPNHPAPPRASAPPDAADELDDIADVRWAAKQLGLALSTTYRAAAAGELPGAFRVRGSWRISKVRFNQAVHGQ